MASSDISMVKTTTSSDPTRATSAGGQHLEQSGDDRQTLRKRCLAQRKTSEALLALWWPIGSEPDWRPFASQLRKAGWHLALPCMDGSDKPLVFARYDENTVLRPAGLGTMEPEDAQRVCPWIIAAPCVGFFQSFRLGYGGGYYDRTLALLDAQARARTVALAYSICEVIFQPHPHDIAFAAVVTEATSPGEKS
ncbi:MAG: 5-formyltetrahydrofolate cyclo-ligase [Betaproteobacteria bacterium]|nr:5-formyltetrahydrofolate cyclo-ligase [Betaproteobacteria bacterium]